MAINAGTDEYIGWPETEGESVASGRALIRRSKEAGLFGKAPFYCPELRGAAGVRGAEEGLCVREGDGIYQA